jgi:signal transduction histidine kinase
VRRRILVATATVAFAAIAVFGVPLALLARGMMRGDALRRLDREADAINFAVDGEVLRQQPVDPAKVAAVLRPDRRVVVVDPVGRRTVVGPDLPGRTLTAAVQAASGTSVRITAPAHDTDERALGAVVVVAGLATAGVAVAIALANLVARRLARPLSELAATSVRLGAGDFSARAGSYDIVEADEVAAALNATAQRLEELVEAERSFSSNASHQLRTPLTALRLHVEELAASVDEEVRREAELALLEADRLDRTIADLLAFARRGHAGPREEVDISALLGDRAAMWGSLFEPAGRQALVQCGASCLAVASSAALCQALDALVDNSARHGRGTTTIAARMHPGFAEIVVSDEGDGVPDGAEARIFDRHTSLRGGTGVGLSLAQRLVEADGGRLELLSARPPAFRILLPTSSTLLPSS